MKRWSVYLFVSIVFSLQTIFANEILNTVSIKETTYQGKRIVVNDALGNQIHGAVLEKYASDNLFTVSHPDYGIALAKQLGNGKPVTVPLVDKNSDAYKRAIRGRIVEQDGSPIENVIIKSQYVRTLGQGLINSLLSQEYMSLSDEDGYFSFYLPNEQTLEQRGYLVPPDSSYHVNINAPEELFLVPFVGSIENNQNVTIEMKKGKFRKFAFEDDEGIINDINQLKKIYVSMLNPDGSRLSLSYSDFIKGGVYPDGKYSAYMNMDGSTSHFLAIDIDDNSPDELVFKFPDKVTYTGKVVHGITGEPMRGAFVIEGNGSGGNKLSMITSEQWKTIHELPLDVPITNPAYDSLREVFKIKRVERTDDNGLYQIRTRPGDFAEFTIFDENYIGFIHRTNIVKADKNGLVELPDIRLYPAAIVLVEPHIDIETMITAHWNIDASDNPSWVNEFLSADDGMNNRFIYQNAAKEFQVQSFYVPACMNVRFWLDTPYARQYQPVEIPELLNLGQGQKRDLGSFTFEPAIEVYAQVVNSQEEPVEGIPVRILVNGKMRGMIYNSDESGIAKFYAFPNSDIEFRVMYIADDRVQQKESVFYNVESKDDEGKLYKFQLSEEIISKFFNSGEIL